MQQLVVVAPDGEEWSVTLGDDDIIIGREPGLPVMLDSVQVSRRHARLFRRNDSYWIEDMGSSNGVVVGGAPIDGPARLALGTQFMIGGFRLSIIPGGASSQPIYALAGRTEPCLGQSIGLPIGSIDVGRGDNVTIPIEHVSISRRHAVIVVTSTSLTVEDQSSSNGTWVNGERVTRRGLILGDEVRFGSVVFILEKHDGIEHDVIPRSISRRRLLKPASVAVVVMMCIAVAAALMWRQSHKSDAVHKAARAFHLHAPHWLSVWRNKPGALGAEELQYEQALAASLNTAQNQAQSQAWPLALTSFSAILKRDPLNAKARAGAEQSELALEEQQVVAQAQQALAQGQSARAFSQVSSLMARGADSPALSSIADKARLSIAQRCMDTANTACAAKTWPACQTQAICTLAYQPHQASGWALLEEAENGMRTHAISYTPYSGTTANRVALQTQYADDKVREAVLRYGSGDAAGGQRRARNAGRRGKETAALLATVVRSQAAGDTAAASGDTTHAVEKWAEALAADKQLLPAGQPSVVGAELHRKIGKELLQQGEQAFNRGLYSAAFAAWLRGMSLEPDNVELSEAMAKLESRATRLLDGVSPQTPPDATLCARLRDVISMTRAEYPAHRDAAARAATCPAQP